MGVDSLSTSTWCIVRAMAYSDGWMTLSIYIYWMHKIDFPCNVHENPKTLHLADIHATLVISGVAVCLAASVVYNAIKIAVHSCKHARNSDRSKACW